MQIDPKLPQDSRELAASALKAYNGSTLIYVGEPLVSKAKGTATARPLLARRLKDGGWKEFCRVQLPNWPDSGTGTQLQVWKRQQAQVAARGDHGRSTSLPESKDSSGQAVRKELESGADQLEREAYLRWLGILWDANATESILLRLRGDISNDGVARYPLFHPIERDLFERASSRFPLIFRCLFRPFIRFAARVMNFLVKAECLARKRRSR